MNTNGRGKPLQLGGEPKWGGGVDKTHLIQLEANSNSGLVSFIQDFPLLETKRSRLCSQLHQEGSVRESPVPAWPDG